MPVEPGQTLLHYRLIENIGEGGIGVVRKAEDTRPNRQREGLHENALAWAAGLVTTLVLTSRFHRVIMGKQFDAVFAKLGGAPAPVLGIIVCSVVTAIMVYLYRRG